MPPFRHTMAVRFADVDHARIVYYPVFFHYFHVTFEEFFRQRLGGRAYVSLLDDEGIGFPSVSAQCEYKAPLRFGDTMFVDMSIERLGEKSVRFRFRVYRAPDAPEPSGIGGSSDAAGTAGSGGAVLAAEGTNTCAIVDLRAFRAVSMPANVRALLEPLCEPQADV